MVELVKTLDGLDDAIIGVGRIHTQPTRVVYDYHKILEILMERDGASYEDAVEFFDYNIGCLWCGDDTPIILTWGDMAMVQQLAEEGE